MNDTFPIQPMTKKVGFNLTITLLMAFDMVSGLVERFGADYITPMAESWSKGYDGIAPVESRCFYATEQNGVLTPQCIVAWVFADLGLLRVLVTETAMVNGGGVNSENYTDASGLVCNLGGFGLGVANHLSEQFGITVDEDARRFLSDVQMEQDGGGTWGDALEYAAERLVRDGVVEVIDTRTATEKVRAGLDA